MTNGHTTTVGDPLDAESASVPSIGRNDLALVAGRTFALSADDGDMRAATHGLVHDDLRHLSRLELWVEEAPIEVLASSAPTPLSAVVVARLGPGLVSGRRAVMTRRRWIASGLRDDVHLQNTSTVAQTWTLHIRAGADFAHVFEVKAGAGRAEQRLTANADGWVFDDAPQQASTLLKLSPRPDDVDATTGTFTWRLHVEPRGERAITITVEPIGEGDDAGIAFPIGVEPRDAIPMRRLDSWRATLPTVTSTDPRLATVVEQSLADLAALRIVDVGHPDRTVIAAGAPWFMTLFGRDSLLASWMTLPFDGSLARGVLASLAELQGRIDDPLAEEQPGKILHELRRHGGGGPFSARQRYYGTVDATPLYVMLAAEACRWGAVGPDDAGWLGPAVDGAVAWMLGDGDSDGDGFVDYRRRHAAGLSNQGWKDSWDGVTFANGALPDAPIALAEVQGYVYAALRGAAELASTLPLSRSADDLTARAVGLRRRFEDAYWDDARGWYAIGLDADGRRIDSLTTNPGHALWCGIASDQHAHQYLDHLMGPQMWTGWGLRTLASDMGAYDPLSYHNGSVWPHDTALCAAGAARYGRWDVVDRIVEGALDAATEFSGRPPELFAGIDRRDAPMPVAYPASCSPQAWSSASVLLLLRTMVGLDAHADGTLALRRRDVSGLADLRVQGILHRHATFTLAVRDGSTSLERSQRAHHGANR